MNANHAHMDIGTFVFDAYGTRWACDYPIKAYQKQRNVLAEAGISTGELFNYAQDSYRWSLFCYGNERHNTLIINGKRLDVAGKGELLGDNRCAQDRSHAGMRTFQLGDAGRAAAGR